MHPAMRTRTDALEGEGSDDYGTLTSMTVGETAEQRAERMKKEYLCVTGHLYTSVDDAE